MKNIRRIKTVIILLSFFTLNLNAQDVSTLGFFASIPVGEFASTDLKNGGGFAEPGWGIVFDSRMRQEKWMKGLYFHFHSTYQWNKMNTDLIQELYTKSSGYKTTISESKYSPIFTTVGIGYDYSITDKISIGFFPSAGVVFGNTKAFTVKVYDDTDQLLANEVVNFDNNVAFAYALSIDLSFEVITDLLSIGLYADYAYSKQSTDVDFSTAEPITSFQKLQYINTGIKLIVTKK